MQHSVMNQSDSNPNRDSIRSITAYFNNHILIFSILFSTDLQTTGITRHCKSRILCTMYKRPLLSDLFNMLYCQTYTCTSVLSIKKDIKTGHFIYIENMTSLLTTIADIVIRVALSLSAMGWATWVFLLISEQKRWKIILLYSYHSKMAWEI